MTHPTLGYANFRFAGDDAVHMPATPTATMTVACDAGNGPLSGEQPFPYDVDAAVTCPNCLHALESDWWMAFMENERRTGEVSSLSGTLDDVRDAMGRLLSQADAVAEETMLGGGASMVEQPRWGALRPLPVPPELLSQGDWPRRPIPPALAGSAQTPEVQQTLRQALADTVLNVHLDVSSDYLFAQDAVTFRARQGDAKAYEHVQNPITPEKLDGLVESLAQQLANQRAPLVPRHEPKVAKPGPFAGDVPLADPGAERVRRMMELSADGMGTSLTDSVHAAIDAGSGWNTKRVRQILDAGVQKMNALPKGSTLSEQVRAAADAADEFLAEHPFDNARPPHDCDADSCSGQTSDPPCGGCCRCLSGCVYDGPDEVEFTHGGEVVDRSEYDYPDRNWCHRHNREAQAGREECSECNGEQGEDRKAGES